MSGIKEFVWEPLSTIHYLNEIDKLSKEFGDVDLLWWGGNMGQNSRCA